MKPGFFTFILLVLSLHVLRGQVYILDEQFNSAPAVPATLTGSGGPFGSASGSSNYGRNAPSLTFNTTGQRLQYGPWTNPADHVSFYHKGTSGAGSQMLVEESADGVTWTAVGMVTAITTAATWDSDLLNTSRYVRITFTLNSTCNVYMDDLRIRNATNTCVENIQLLQVLINGGCGSCEGSEEFIYFDTGGNSMNIQYFELVSQTVPAGGNSYGGNGAINNLNTNWVLSANYTTLQTNYIANLNLWASCPGVFVPAPANNIIPAHARVIAFTGATPTATYNMNSICEMGTIYVIFADQTNCGGKYANSSCSSNCARFITLFNHQTGCIDNQEYVANSSNTTAGNGYIFVEPNIGYTSTANCSFLILSVRFGAFSAKLENDDVLLRWTTLSEERVSHFEIERSKDGYYFETIGHAACVNEPLGASYSFSDKDPISGYSYYRIKAINWDGIPDYSDMAVVLNESNEIQLISRKEEVEIAGPKENNGTISIYNSSGQLMFFQQRIINDSDWSLHISTLSWASGIYYFVMIGNEITKQGFYVE
ncbi:MAG: T9SS type A sorting domain-containing protein [Flavobacteriales bacterium]